MKYVYNNPLVVLYKKDNLIKIYMNKVSAPHSFFFGETKHVINGEVVQDEKITSVDDGKKMQLRKCDNDRCNNYQIKDTTLKRLLSKNISSSELMDRLNKNYRIKKSFPKRSHRSRSRTRRRSNPRKTMGKTRRQQVRMKRNKKTKRI